MTDESVLAQLRACFGSIDAVYLAPTIPASAERAARRAHADHLPATEHLLASYDSSGDEGFVVTSRRVCWKNAGERGSVEWRDLDVDRMLADGPRLVIGAGAILAEPPVVAACEEAFYLLAVSARAAGAASPGAASASGVVPALAPPARAPSSTNATPPPPHAVSFASYAVHAASQRAPSFACWSCKTPLYWSTPQCARCGALPTARGWLRIA